MPVLRRAAALVVVLATLAPATARADDPLAGAQARVEQARRAANDAANRYEAAQTRYYTLDNEIRRTQAGVDELKAQTRVLVRRARARAIEAYVTGSNPGLDGIVEGSDVLDAVRRTQFLDRVNAAGDEAVDELGTMLEELDVRERNLNAEIEQQKKINAALRDQEAQLRDRLAQAQNAERELRARIEAAKKASADRARIARAQSVLSGGGETTGSSGVIVGGGSWACPAPGSSFGDSFGAPRSGGRRHQGVDMMAPRGSSAVATVNGSISHSTSGLGGNQIWLHGSDGNTYFYAHLDSYVGPPRSVSLGELIGHIGDTGNARGGPTHLHFEIHPGGGSAVDPYPTVRAHC